MPELLIPEATVNDPPARMSRITSGPSVKLATASLSATATVNGPAKPCGASMTTGSIPVGTPLLQFGPELNGPGEPPTQWSGPVFSCGWLGTVSLLLLLFEFEVTVKVGVAGPDGVLIGAPVNSCGPLFPRPGEPFSSFGGVELP